MKVWRVHIRPDAEKSENPFDVCTRQGVIGIGWRVSRKPSSWDDYISLGTIKYGDRGWTRAAKAIGVRMAPGDLVWVRDFYGAYHIGMISGPWEYRDELENLRSDIINVRQCKLYRVGTMIAGKIINCFRPPAAIQQIDDRTAELFSILTYNKVTGSEIPFVPPPNADIFSLLSDVDLEDVVGLYLQYSKGLLFLPSSRSRDNSTISHEYELIDSKFCRAVYVQVKSGNEILDPSNYYNFPDEFYLFSPAGYLAKSQKNHVFCIDRKDIEAFLDTARNFLPSSISVWLDMADKLIEN